MEQQQIRFLDFCHEPILALEGERIAHLNPAARTLFPSLTVGQSAAGLFPDYLLADTAEQITASAMLGGQEFTVCAMRSGDARLLSLRAERPVDRSLVSDGLMNSLNSALFNVGLAARLLWKRTDFSCADTQHCLMLMQHNYHQLVRQFSNLGTAIRLQEKAQLPHLRRCDLVAMCSSLVASINSLGDGVLAPLEFSSALPDLLACVDRDLTVRMLLNLLDNSFAHCTAGCRVLLRLEKRGDRAFFSVDDDGSGIPAEVLQNVFSRYENRIRSDLLTEQPRSGLGLVVARGIAELHGGALIIEGKPGRGTSVRVMLPLEQHGSDLLEDSQADPDDVRLDTLLTELSDVLHAESYRWELQEETTGK